MFSCAFAERKHKMPDTVQNAEINEMLVVVCWDWSVLLGGLLVKEPLLVFSLRFYKT